MRARSTYYDEPEIQPIDETYSINHVPVVAGGPIARTSGAFLLKRCGVVSLCGNSTFSFRGLV
jgi:hypothetical protein